MYSMSMQVLYCESFPNKISDYWTFGLVMYMILLDRAIFFVLITRITKIPQNITRLLSRDIKLFITWDPMSIQFSSPVFLAMTISKVANHEASFRVLYCCLWMMKMPFPVFSKYDLGPLDIQSSDSYHFTVPHKILVVI